MQVSGHSGWATARSFTRDRSVAQRKLAPGTTRRIMSYARPYKRLIGVFLALVVFDAMLVVATPLLFRRLVDDGVARGNRGLVIGLALLIQPAVGAAVGWFAYGERLGAADLAGVALVAAALVLVRRGPAPLAPGTADVAEGTTGDDIGRVKEAA